MQSTFIGRENLLQDVANLINAKEGAIYAVKGNAGMGKSELLKHLAEIHRNRAQVFIDLNDLPPIQTAVEFLRYAAQCAHGLEQTQNAVKKIDGTYKTTEDLISPYESLLSETARLGLKELGNDLTEDEKNKGTGIAKILIQLGQVWFKSKAERDKAKLGDPELYFLNALKRDCKAHPLIFIDTYERLQASETISQQKITSKYGRPHEFLSPSSASLRMQDWLERFLSFLKKHSAIVIVAGRKAGCWDGQAHKVERFNDEEILNLAGGSAYPLIQQAVAEYPDESLKVLTQLSFGGIPLWLQLAINFVGLELDAGKSIAELAETANLHDHFNEPETKTDLQTANVENASCKLALFNRVMQHNLRLSDNAWLMALPRRLDKVVLNLVYGEQADSIREAFVKAGLLPSMRLIDDEQSFYLHEEIRDLLLAYARYQQWFEADQARVFHQKLASLYEERYRQQPNIQSLLEQLYHQAMKEDDARIESIRDIHILGRMALDFQRERQYSKMSQVCLKWIAIEPKHENAWYGLGVSLGRQGRLQEAEQAFRRQIAIEPDHEWAWYNLGVALAKQSRFEEAAQAYSRQAEIKLDEDRSGSI